MIVKWVQNGTSIWPKSVKNRSKTVPGVIGCSWGVSWRSLGGPWEVSWDLWAGIGSILASIWGAKMFKKIIKIDARVWIIFCNDFKSILVPNLVTFWTLFC